jgi:GntR family transcriptional regulator
MTEVVFEYQRIAEVLRSKIRKGALKGRLPDEKALAAEYGVANQTMRSALKILSDEGFIDRKRKVGSIVRSTGKFLRDGPGRLRAGGKRFLAADIDDRPLNVTGFRSEVRTAREEEPNVVRCFGLSVPLIVRERVYEADGEPVSMASTFIPQWLFQDGGEAVLRKNTGPEGVSGLLRNAGYEPVEADETIEVRPATTAEARRLKLSSGAWVLVITRPFEDQRGMVVDLTVMTLPASLWILRYPVMKSSSQ